MAERARSPLCIHHSTQLQRSLLCSMARAGLPGWPVVGCRKKAQVKYTVSLLLRALGRPGKKTLVLRLPACTFLSSSNLFPFCTNLHILSVGGTVNSSVFRFKLHQKAYKCTSGSRDLNFELFRIAFKSRTELDRGQQKPDSALPYQRPILGWL